MTYLGLAALGGLSVWVAVVTGRGISGAHFNRALRAYVSPFDAPPENVAAPATGRRAALVATRESRTLAVLEHHAGAGAPNRF